MDTPIPAQRKRIEWTLSPASLLSLPLYSSSQIRAYRASLSLFVCLSELSHRQFLWNYFSFPLFLIWTVIMWWFHFTLACSLPTVGQSELCADEGSWTSSPGQISVGFCPWVGRPQRCLSTALRRPPNTHRTSVCVWKISSRLLQGANPVPAGNLSSGFSPLSLPQVMCLWFVGLHPRNRNHLPHIHHRAAVSGCASGHSQAGLAGVQRWAQLPSPGHPATPTPSAT